MPIWHIGFHNTPPPVTDLCFLFDLFPCQSYYLPFERCPLFAARCWGGISCVVLGGSTPVLFGQSCLLVSSKCDPPPLSSFDGHCDWFLLDHLPEFFMWYPLSPPDVETMFKALVDENLGLLVESFCSFPRFWPLQEYSLHCCWSCKSFVSVPGVGPSILVLAWWASDGLCLSWY